MPMPRNGFDRLAACARLNTDSTMYHRERWPSLAWVWDELDMLRECWVTAIDADDHAALGKELDAALDERDSFQNALKAALQALDDGDTTRAESILSGVVE